MSWNLDMKRLDTLSLKHFHRLLVAIQVTHCLTWAVQGLCWFKASEVRCPWKKHFNFGTDKGVDVDVFKIFKDRAFWARALILDAFSRFQSAFQLWSSLHLCRQITGSRTCELRRPGSQEHIFGAAQGSWVFTAGRMVQVLTGAVVDLLQRRLSSFPAEARVLWNDFLAKSRPSWNPSCLLLRHCSVPPLVFLLLHCVHDRSSLGCC